MENQIIKEKNEIALPNIFTFLSALKVKILNNEVDAKMGFKNLRDLKNHLEIILKQIQEKGYTEWKGYLGQSYNGFVPTITMKPTYDYSNNPEWCEVDKRKKEIEEQMKNVCKINNGKDLVDGDSGEIKFSAIKIKESEILTLTPIKK